MVDKAGVERKLDTHEGEHENTANAANRALYADADLSKPQPGDRKTATPQGPQIEIGTEEEYLKSAPKDLRKELGLPANATAEQVYQKKAEGSVAAFRQASSEMQAEALQYFGLKRSEYTVDNVYRAMIAHDRADTKTPASASLADLETAVHKRDYRMIKDGTIPIDVN